MLFGEWGKTVSVRLDAKVLCLRGGMESVMGRGVFFIGFLSDKPPDF